MVEVWVGVGTRAVGVLSDCFCCLCEMENSLTRVGWGGSGGARREMSGRHLGERKSAFNWRSVHSGSSQVQSLPLNVCNTLELRILS